MKNPFKKNETVADIGATVPADNAGYGVTVPAEGAGSTIPVDSIPNSGLESDWGNADYSAKDVTHPTHGVNQPEAWAGDFGNGGVEDIPGTSAVDFRGMKSDVSGQAGAAVRPVVGWLVCTKGANRGSDYRVYNGYNYIGRAQSMDICIPGDSHISNENAAVIGYDDVERVFYIGSVTGHNTVRLNGKLVLGQTLLNAYDKVKLGETTLTFIPLCGEKFDWNGR